MRPGPSTSPASPDGGDGRSAWAVPAWLERGAGWTWRLLVLAVGLAVLAWTFQRLRVVFVPVLVALLLTALVAPVTTRLASVVPRLVAAWVAVLVAVAVVAGVVALAVIGIGGRLTGDTDWQAVLDEIRTWLRDGPLDLSREQVEELEQSVRDWATSGVSASQGVRLAAEVGGGILLTGVLFFFFVKDGPSMWAWVTGRVRPRRRTAVDGAGRAAFGALRGYIRGVAITGVVDAVAIGVGLWLIGVPLVVPLAVITFFGAFFPIVGATAAGALATVVALVLRGPVEAVLAAGLTLAVQQVEGDVIYPLVMRRQVSLHPAVVLVALAVGGALAGIVGAFVAVPLVAMVTAAAREAAPGPAGG